HTGSKRDWSSDVCSSDLDRARRGVASRRPAIAKNPLTTQYVVVYAARHTIPGRGVMAQEPAGDVVQGSGAEAGSARHGVRIARRDRKSTRLNSSHVSISY